MTCRCHASVLYAGLDDCPKCRHRSYDRVAQACERRACGYVGPANPTLWPEGSGR